MKYVNLPEDMQETVKNISAQYPFTIDEVTELYLMGGDHTDNLCQIKLKCMNIYPYYIIDFLIQMANQRLWNDKNKRLWDELKLS